MTSSGDGSGTDGRRAIDPRIRQRRVAVRRSRGRRRLRRVLVASGLVGAAIGILALLHTSLFSVRVVEVTGVHLHTPTAAIESAARVSHQALVSVDAGAVAARVEALPYIARAQVVEHWPDGLQIVVSERVPRLQMAGPGASWSVLDGGGRTIEVQRTRVAGLPVFVARTSAGPVGPTPVGHSLPPFTRPGLLVARTLPLAFSGQVVGVTLAPDGTVDLSLDSGLTVLLGNTSDLLEKYKDVAAIIAHGSLRGAKVIDVTVPQSPTVSDS